MAASHTPLPWTVDAWGSVTFAGARPTQTLLLNGVGTSCSPGPSMDEAKANRDLMVRAVNCHYELLAALIMVRDADNDCHADGLQTIPQIARAKIDAAIAKAEG